MIIREPPLLLNLLHGHKLPVLIWWLTMLFIDLFNIFKLVKMFLILYIQPLASEISSQLFSDNEMKFIYKKLNESLIWCKVSTKK